MSELWDSSEETSDMDAENLEKMKEYRRTHKLGIPCEYLIRGAMLICSNESHKRKVNLPKCHGVYVGEHLLLHEKECVWVCADLSLSISPMAQNISCFGVCMPEDGESPCTGEKTYIMTKKNSKSGTEGVVTGKMCLPIIVGIWQNTYDKTRIVDNGDKVPSDRGILTTGETPTNGQKTVTTDSFLVCKYGSLIMPIDSGQKSLVTSSDFYNVKDYFKVMGRCQKDDKAPYET